jgi:tRNA A-37 threonylcarbamoyl transferase component Bud32
MLQRGTKSVPVQAALAQRFHSGHRINWCGRARMITNPGHSPTVIRNLGGFILKKKPTMQTITNTLRLQQARILIPRMLRFDPKGFIESEVVGETLAERIRHTQNRRHITDLLRKAFAMLGSVHRAGIEHGHPHSRNILVYRNQTALTDFKLARTVSPHIWKKSARRIYTDFYQDYYTLTELVKAAMKRHWSTENADAWRAKFNRVLRPLAENLFRQYPCPEAVKQELLRRYMKEFREV